MNNAGQVNLSDRPDERMLPLVALHGWGLHGGIWRFLAQRMPERNVLMPDLPGYVGKPLVTSLEMAAQQLLTELPARFDLCGWSLGGLLALTMARQAPERVARLVLVGASPCFVVRADWPCGMTEQVFNDFANDLAEAWEPTLKRFLALQVRQDRQAKEALQALRRELFVRGQPEPVTLQIGLEWLLQTDLRQQLADIVQPALVVHGAYDQLVPECAAHVLADSLAHAKLVVMPGASHAPFLSHEAAFLALLNDFLSAQ